MAATAWAFYHEAKHKLAVGDTSGFNLSADIFRLALYKTAATAPADDKTLSIQSQISNQCTGGNYTAGGKALSATTWTATATSVQKFDGCDWVITASGSAITSVLFGVICNSIAATSGFLLCFSQLSTAAFDVSSSNTLTIQMNAAGIFTLA
jgi:hypothetical protein